MESGHLNHMSALRCYLSTSSRCVFVCVCQAGWPRNPIVTLVLLIESSQSTVGWPREHKCVLMWVWVFSVSSEIYTPLAYGVSSLCDVCVNWILLPLRLKEGANLESPTATASAALSSDLELYGQYLVTGTEIHFQHSKDCQSEPFVHWDSISLRTHTAHFDTWNNREQFYEWASLHHGSVLQGSITDVLVFIPTCFLFPLPKYTEMGSLRSMRKVFARQIWS